MSTPDGPTVIARFSGLFLFLSVAVGCFSWFAWSSYNIVVQLTSDLEVVYIDKGSLYMFGAGVGLAALTFAIFYEGILKRTLTKQITKYITRSALVGISLMFILPQILHFPINQYLTGKGYVVCEQVSFQWLLYKKFVYTSSLYACEALARENEITKSSSGR